MTADVELLPLPEPAFGEWLRGIYASESNPLREGMYVRTIRRTGKLNPGVHYEVTDGNGKFWQYPAQSVERLATPPAAQVQPPAEKPVAWWNGISEDKTERSPYGPSIRWGADAENSGHDIPMYAGYNPVHFANPAAQAPAVRVTDVLLRVSDEDLRWCKDAAIALQEAGGPTNNMRAVGLLRLVTALEAALGQENWS